MFALRIYIAALDLFLLAALLMTRGGDAGAAELALVTLPPLYLILEIREELRETEALRRKLAGLGMP